MTRFRTARPRRKGLRAQICCPVRLLELGVNTGESLKVWASFFPAGRIVGIDVNPTPPDFCGHGNIRYEVADQTDTGRLKQIAAAHAPDGFDIVVDDASHIGRYTAASYACLFPLLKPQGLYIVEDWCTGYLDDWPDGSRYQQIDSDEFHGAQPTRHPSHDFGMVGFVKSLMDQAAGGHRRATLHGAITQPDTLAFMHVYKQCVVLQKCAEKRPV